MSHNRVQLPTLKFTISDEIKSKINHAGSGIQMRQGLCKAARSVMNQSQARYGMRIPPIKEIMKWTQTTLEGAAMSEEAAVVTGVAEEVEVAAIAGDAFVASEELIALGELGLSLIGETAGIIALGPAAAPGVIVAVGVAYILTMSYVPRQKRGLFDHEFRQIIKEARRLRRQ